MASTKVTFVTGTAEVKRKALNWDQHNSPLPEQRLTTEPNTPLQVTYIDDKCTCCPYGYHIDLDFLNFCRDLERGSTLKNLKRIQRTKRKLRKSMEMMLDEQEGMAADPSTAPPDVVHSTEAGRLMHMINYERSATQNILHHIDASVASPPSKERGGPRYMSSDSDEPTTPYTPPHGTTYPFDESNRMTTSYSTLNRTDSFNSLSSVSTMSSETAFPQLADQHHSYHQSTSSKTVTKVIENPVIEMGTAEMKHYSTSSSAQLADKHVNEPDIRPSVANRVQVGTPVKSPPGAISKDSPDVTQMSLQSVREAMAVSLQRLRELEEQVKAIPILQVRISVLKEEKRLLNLQLKANKANAKPLTTSVGVGDDRVDVDEKMQLSTQSPRNFDFSKSSFIDSTSPVKKSPLVKTPPATLPKPGRTFSVGVGDHSVLEPYNIQPDLPTGYTIQDNDTVFEIHSRTVTEQTSVPLIRNIIPSLNMSFQNSPSDRESRSPLTIPTVSDSGQPLFTINQIQRSTPKALTRTVGIGDGNVFEGSGLHVHEKELRTVIIGQNTNVAKRNVGIECRVPTRDVGVLFICDEAKPETRTVGVNVSYDTSDIMTSLDFKGENELRIALRGVLQRNVRSVGTNCNFRPVAIEKSTATDQSTGISVGCGDENHRVDVEIRPVAVKKSVATVAKPEAGHKCIGTERGWVFDAGTNTYQAETYHKSVMTDKQKQMFSATNTEPVLTRLASCQTEFETFVSLGAVSNAASNTEQVKTYSTGIITDIIPTFSTGVNTTEKVSDLFQQPSEQKTVKTKELKSILKKPRTGGSPVGEGKIETTPIDLPETSKKVTSENRDRLFSSQSYMKKSSYLSRSEDGNGNVTTLEALVQSPSVAGSFIDSRENLLNRSSSQEDLDKRNSAFERVSPTKSEDRFSETVVEHYIITKDGKKLISEEKTTTNSAGTNRSFRQYSGVEKDPWSQEVIEPESLGSESVSSSIGVHKYSTSSGDKFTPGRVNGGTVVERGYASVIHNPYMTVENLAEVSSILDSELGSDLGHHHISKTASENNLCRESREVKPLLEKATSGDLLYDMHRTGSVEDFMPEDIRRYMSIDPSASKDSGFGEDLIQRFTEELSGPASQKLMPGEAAKLDTGGVRSIKTSKIVTTKRTTKSGDNDVVVTETKTTQGPGGYKTTVVRETRSDGQQPDQGEIDLEAASVASSTHSSSRFLGQHASDSNLSSSNQFPETASLNASGIKSFSETAITSVGDSDDELMAAVGNCGSLDRKTGKLKSIMKRRPSDPQQIGNRRGITFAESVIGGMGSSSQEEDNTSDSDSSTSFEEGSYDGQQGEVIYYCKDDEAIAQGLPGAQMFDQNIRETYELPTEVREACNVLADYLMDSTSIQTKQLNACQSAVQREWFQVSSHKLSVAHQVEDFLSSINEISKRLLEYIINMADANGNTAIHYCVSHCNFEIVSLLLDSEVCDTNKQNKAGYTPVMLAGLATVQNPEHREVVRRLFSLGDVNGRSATTQQTALMLAASHGRTEMVKLLIEEGADINLQDVDGSTALMCACEHGYLDIVCFLLAQPDIDANITDNENSTALSIAMEAGHKDVGVVLYKHLNFSKAASPGGHKKRRSSTSPTPSNFPAR